MGMRRSIDTNTRRASTAGPAPPPNPALHGEHHISAKIKLSPLDLWTVSKRFRTNCYLVATFLKKGSKCNFNKKKGCMSRASEIQEYCSCWKVHTSTAHPTLSSQSSQGQNIFLSPSSLNLHLIIISKRGRGARQ